MKRVLSLVLSLIMAFSIVTGMDISVFAAGEYENHAKYLAELTFNGDYIHYDYLKKFQYDMKAASEYMVDSTVGTKVEKAFETWDGICTIAQPSGLVEDLTLQEQYEAMIYTIVLETLASEGYVDFTYENALSNSIDFINLLSETTNGAQLYDKKNLTADDKLILKNCANKLTSASSSGWGALAEYTSIVGEIGDIVDSIIEISVSTAEIIDRTSALLQLTENLNYVVAYLERVKNAAPNYIMRAAVQEVIENVAGSAEEVVADAVLDWTFSLGVVANKYAVDFLYGELCLACPILAGVVIGLNAGIAISDLLFARSQEVEQYAHMKKFTELMTASRTALRYAENSCAVNITYETAAEWVFGVDFVHNVYISNQNCAIEYYKTVSTGGWVQKVKSLFDSSIYESYENYKVTVENYNEYYSLALYAFHNFWVCDFSEDFPETYKDYMNIRDKNYDSVDDIAPQLDFATSSYELAMNQTVNIPVVVYPATNTSLIYSSSDESIITVASDGTITPVGEGTAKVIATDKNGVQASCEISVYPFNISKVNTSYRIDKYVGNSTVVSIPEEINNINVTGIGNSSFWYCTKLTTITIPNSVTYISVRAFQGCKNLTSITLPNNIETIGERAFDGCANLFTITIGDNLTSIGDFAFEGCSNLNAVYITDISNWCNISFARNSSNPLYHAKNLYLNGELVTDLIIPNDVTSIKYCAFYNCISLTSVTISDKVTNIFANAFAHCTNLKSIKIGNGVTNIGVGAFFDCTKLSSLTISDSVTSIENSAFSGCTSLTSVTIPVNVKSINGSVFASCASLETINVNSDNQFYTSVNGVLFNKNKTNLIYYPTDKTSDSYIIPDSVNSIGYCAFYDSNNLTSVTIPETVTYIDEYAFYRCSLTSLTIPDSVETIDEYAFYCCSNISSVTIGDNVTSINDGAFAGCTGIKAVYISDIANWCGINFYNEYTNPLYYAKKLYLNGELVADLIIPHGVTSIEDYVFSNCTSLSSVTIPDSITSIGWSFQDCTNLKAVYISDIANWCDISFDNNPLYYAKNLYLNGELVTDLIIPNSVTRIAEDAFWNCKNLTSITIPDSVTSIGVSAFTSCTNLTSITIPDSVTSIGDWAFENCSDLDYVFYTGSESEWSNITKGNYNQPLNDAIIHYNSINHNFGELLSIEPTCEEAGKKYYECSICGYNDILEVLPATGHDFSSEWTIDIEPTCAEKGSRSKTCLTCGDILTETISALEHSYSNEWTIDKAATCIEDGSKSHHCTICGDKTDVTILAATGHNFVDDVCLLCGTISGLSYEVYDNYVVITGYEGFKSDVVIPDTIAGLPVTGIGEEAFYNCTSLNSIVIPDGVTNIGNYAFCSCTNLVSITIPYGVTAINDYTFSNCTKLSSIIIPDGVTNIGVGAFWSCIKLTSITIPDSVTSISKNAFQNCNVLTDVYYWGALSDWQDIDIDATGNDYLINSTVSHRCVNNNCNYLDEWTIDVQPTCTKEGSKSHHCSVCGYKTDITEISSLGHDYSDEWTIDKDATCTENGSKSHHCSRCDSKIDVTVIAGVTSHSWVNGICPVCEISPWSYETHDDYIVITGYNGFKSDVVMPDTITGLPVTEIDDFAFAENSVLKSITIGKNVTKIGEGVFYFCPNLQTVTISDSVTSISDLAFCFCESLVSINVDENNINFSSVNGVLFDKNIETLIQYPVGKKDITYRIPDSVKSIGDVSFYFCNNLSSIIIPKTVISIGYVAFCGCENLVSVVLPNTVSNIGEMAFAECTNLSSVTIPDSVTSIGEDAFYNIPGKIYCVKDSEAHEHAVANNIDYVLVSVLETSNTYIDYDTFLIHTSVENCNNITDILGISSTANIVATASYKQNNHELLGTGTIISVYEGGTLIGNYTLVVNGDTNGDSICDALDCFEVERAANGNTNLSDAYAMAADSNSDDVVDITDYQAIVNKALAS